MEVGKFQFEFCFSSIGLNATAANILAALTIAALWHLVINPSLLHRMQFAFVSQTFNGDDFLNPPLPTQGMTLSILRQLHLKSSKR